MSKETSDDVKATRFRKPVKIEVNKMAWEMLCDELQRKATIGSFFFLAAGILVSLVLAIMSLGGTIVFIACIGLAIYLNIGVRRRFKHLRTLSDHSFTISGNQIVHQYPEETQTIPFQKIKHIEFHNWGLELDVKSNRKPNDKESFQGRILIPGTVNDYDRIVATFEAVKNN